MFGTVIKSTGSWYSVLMDDGKKANCRIKGKMRLQGIKNTNPVAVGDRVETEEDTIIKILPRRNYIIRKSINLSKQTHIIAANIDQAFLIVTLALPRTSTGFIDRFLLTAEAYRIPVNIVFNKTDIYPKEGLDEITLLENIYTKLNYHCYRTSALENKGMEDLKKIMQGKINLLSGHSGVGKSTLINCLEPKLNLRTGILSAAHDKGKHTTTFAEMFELSDGGFIVDTPGIKEFGLVDMKREELSHYFPEMRALMNKCKFNSCLHLNEPGCAVIEAVEKKGIAESRYYNYLNILSGDELKFTNY